MLRDKDNRIGDKAEPKRSFQSRDSACRQHKCLESDADVQRVGLIFLCFKDIEHTAQRDVIADTQAIGVQLIDPPTRCDHFHNSAEGDGFNLYRCERLARACTDGEQG